MDEDDKKFAFGYVIAIPILLLLGVGLHVYKDGIQAHLEARFNTNSHFVDLREGMRLAQVIVEARVGDEITLRVKQKAQLYIKEIEGEQQAYALRQDETGEVSWIVRHPGIVKMGCALMPDFELIVKAPE